MMKHGLDDDKMYVYMCMAGEEQQGGPGCTYVDHVQGRAFYVRLNDLEPKSFRTTFAQTVEDDENKHFFVVHRVEDQIHVVSFPRDEACKTDWSPYQKAVHDMYASG